ncbi:MAG: PadR family transcriptional regulator [Solirubrobacterales bacterium]
MSRRSTEQAVARAAPIDSAREAAGVPGAGGPGTADPVAGELRRAGIVPLLVLHLLSAGPSYGNALIEGISVCSGGLIDVNPNTMYPLLRSLEEQGMVTGEWEHPERRSRRFYAITPEGEKERARLASVVTPRLAEVAGSLERRRSELA